MIIHGKNEASKWIEWLLKMKQKIWKIFLFSVFSKSRKIPEILKILGDHFFSLILGDNGGSKHTFIHLYSTCRSLDDLKNRRIN